MSRVVLGAGPVGLVAAYVLSTDCVVGTVPGGGGVRTWAPTFVWRNDAMERLLRSLGAPTTTREVRVGYLGPTGIKLVASASEREEYYRRSRGIPADVDVKLPSSAMSSGRRTFEAFDLSMDALTNALLCAVRVVEKTVVRIGARDRTAVAFFEDGSVLETEEMINTLPAPVFDRLAGRLGRTWEAGKKVFVRGVDRFGLDRARMEGLSYLYVTDPDLEFDRVNLLDDVVYEFNDREPTPAFLETVEGEVVTRGRFQIRGEPRKRRDDKIPEIKHVGRLARWDHRIRVHDVAEECYAARS